MHKAPGPNYAFAWGVGRASTLTVGVDQAATVDATRWLEEFTA
jgi:hypothetical protein